MKLELAVLAGAESKEFLVKLTKQIDRLEALCGKLGNLAMGENDDGDTEVEADEDEDFGKKPSKKKAKGFDEDEETEVESEDAEEESDEESEADEEVEEDEAPVKKGKGKKLTIDDCNDAAKALALSVGGKPGRAKVLALMKKHFKTESVSELKPEQYAKFIALMKENTEE